MKNTLVIVGLLAVVLHATAQEQTGQAAPAPPSTKLEAFSAKTGLVLIKGYTNIGIVSGLGRVIISAREFRDASNPKSTQYGVAFEVKEAGRLEREHTSFVDEDEIDSLLRGLEYISKIDKTVTTFYDFEASYRTKGDLSITVFSDRSGETSLAVTSGRIGRASAYFKLSEAEQFKLLLAQAKKDIAQAKQVNR